MKRRRWKKTKLAFFLPWRPWTNFQKISCSIFWSKNGTWYTEGMRILGSSFRIISTLRFRLKENRATLEIVIFACLGRIRSEAQILLVSLFRSEKQNYDWKKSYIKDLFFIVIHACHYYSFILPSLNIRFLQNWCRILSMESVISRFKTNSITAIVSAQICIPTLSSSNLPAFIRLSYLKLSIRRGESYQFDEGRLSRSIVMKYFCSLGGVQMFFGYW